MAQSDDVALQAMIDAAGEGAVVNLEANKTYDICRPIRPLKNQTIDLHGSTFRKCDEKIAQVLAYEGAGVWLVDDASSFEVGEWITVSSNGGFDRTTGWLVVQDIQGNRIRSIEPIEEPLENLTLTTDGPLFYIRNAGVTIQNFVFDGNYQNNGTIIKWDTSILVIVSAPNTLVQDGEVFEIPGDFLQFSIDSDNSELRNVSAERGAGAFVHLTGIGLNGQDGVRIIDNRIIDLGREFKRQQHAFGAIEWSQNVGNVIVEGNYFEDLRIAAINIRDDQRGEFVLVKNNVAVSTEGFLLVLKFDKASNGTRQKIRVEGNQMTDTKGSIVETVQVDETFFDIEIVDNQSDNSYWDISGVENLNFVGNEMVISDMSAAGLDPSMDIQETRAILTAKAIKNASIEENTFEGNWRQLFVENLGKSSGYEFEDHYKINENVFLDFLFSAIEGSATQNGVGQFNETLSWSSRDNTLVSSVLGLGTDLRPAGIAAIYSAGGSHLGNCVEITSPSNDTFAAQVYGLASPGDSGNGGSFTDNAFLNHNGKSVAWGVLDQHHALEASATTISDRWPIGLLDTQNPSISGTQVDGSESCDLERTSTSSMDWPASKKLVDVFPVPARDLVKVKIGVEESIFLDSSLFSLQGEKVLTLFRGLVLEGRDRTFPVDLSSLPAGLYFVKTTSHLGSNVTKLILVK